MNYLVKVDRHGLIRRTQTVSYIKASLKGRPYHNEILNSGRLLPRERGLKAWKGRGTFEKDTPMIMCVHQRGRNDIF